MNTLTLTPRPDLKLLVVNMPEGSCEHRYTGVGIMYWNNDGWYEYFDLPPGKYSIIGKLSEITEEQAKDLVLVFQMTEIDMDRNPIGPTEVYPNDYRKGHSFTDTALESLHSLIRASGGKETDNLLILKVEV